MSRNNVIRVLLLSGLLCAAGATHAVASRIYGAPCGQPSGLPGLLLKMHFISKGTCAISPTGGCVNNNACTIQPLSGTPISGTCRPLANNGGCTCVANAN